MQYLKDFIWNFSKRLIVFLSSFQANAPDLILWCITPHTCTYRFPHGATTFLLQLTFRCCLIYNGIPPRTDLNIRQYTSNFWRFYLFSSMFHPLWLVLYSKHSPRHPCLFGLRAIPKLWKIDSNSIWQNLWLRLKPSRPPQSHSPCPEYSRSWCRHKALSSSRATHHSKRPL